MSRDAHGLGTQCLARSSEIQPSVAVVKHTTTISRLLRRYLLSTVATQRDCQTESKTPAL